MGRKKKVPEGDMAGTGTASESATAAPAKRINKMEIVRQALKKLGDEAKPTEIRDLVAKKNHLQLSLNLISNYKNSILKKVSGQSAVLRAPAASPSRSNGVAGGISLDDIQAVKTLAERLGVAKLHSLIDVLER